MRLLGQALSGAGVPFIAARASHRRAGDIGTTSEGEVACETQEQCDAIAAWAERESWNLTTRVATAEEVAEHKKWSKQC
jgi:hypothetical protein